MRVSCLPELCDFLLSETFLQSQQTRYHPFVLLLQPNNALPLLLPIPKLQKEMKHGQKRKNESF